MVDKGVVSAEAAPFVVQRWHGTDTVVIKHAAPLSTGLAAYDVEAVRSPAAALQDSSCHTMTPDRNTGEYQSAIRAKRRAELCGSV